MLGQIGLGGFILIMVVVLLLFGPSKLPELGRAFGRTLREFKLGAREILEDEQPLSKEAMSRSERNPSLDSPIASQDRRLPE